MSQNGGPPVACPIPCAHACPVPPSRLGCPWSQPSIIPHPQAPQRNCPVVQVEVQHQAHLPPHIGQSTHSAPSHHSHNKVSEAGGLRHTKLALGKCTSWVFPPKASSKRKRKWEGKGGKGKDRKEKKEKKKTDAAGILELAVGQ